MSTFWIVWACVTTQFQNASFKFICFTLFLLLLREKHEVFLLICLFLLITNVFLKFKRILFGKNIRWCTFKVPLRVLWGYTEATVHCACSSCSIPSTVLQLGVASAAQRYCDIQDLCSRSGRIWMLIYVNCHLYVTFGDHTITEICQQLTPVKACGIW